MRRLLFISAFLSLSIVAGAVIAGPVTAGHDAAAAGTVEGVGPTVFPISIIDCIYILIAMLVTGAWLKTRSYRLPRRPADALTLLPEYLIVFLAGMLMAQSLGLGAFHLLQANGETLAEDVAGEPALEEIVRITTASIGGQVLVAGVYAAVMFARSRKAKLKSEPSTRYSYRRAAGLALISFPVVFLILMIVNFAMTFITWLMQSPQPPKIAHSTLEAIVNSDAIAWKIAMIFLVVCIVPIVEELMFRGLVQELLSRLRFGHWPAILITSAGFTAMHIGAADWHVLPSLFVLSLGLGWVYARTGRLLAPILLHAAFNAANTALGVLTSAGG